MHVPENMEQHPQTGHGKKEEQGGKGFPLNCNLASGIPSSGAGWSYWAGQGGNSRLIKKGGLKTIRKLPKHPILVIKRGSVRARRGSGQTLGGGKEKLELHGLVTITSGAVALGLPEGSVERGGDGREEDWGIISLLFTQKRNLREI